MLTTDAAVRGPGPPAGGAAGAPRRGRGGARPAAASTLSPAWLYGPPGPARVVAAFELAAYLLRDGEVLPVLAPGALALPGGLRVASAADLHDVRLRVGAEVLVGHGEVAGPGGTLAVRRPWRPSPVPSATLPVHSPGMVVQAVLGLPGLTDDLPPAVLEAVPHVLRAARPDALVGLGPGLTPAGDDLLCGMLLALRATGHEAGRARLEETLAPLLDRTTALSATLLRHAALGYAVPPVVDLLRAWHAGADVPRLRRHAEEVADVGHTSGRALLLGLAAVLTATPGDALAIPSVPASHPHEPVAVSVGARRGPS